jgi:hypothetical protein
MNPKLFLVARENHLDNQELFEAVGAQIVMHPSTIIAERIRVLLATPLLSELATYARYRDHAWACELISRIAALVEDRVPEVWEVTIDADQAPAICAATGQGSPVTLEALLSDRRDREAQLPAIALLLVHRSERTLLPEGPVVLRRGDRILFCGAERARSRMEWTLHNDVALDYVLSGESHHPGTLWSLASRLVRGPVRHRD